MSPKHLQQYQTAIWINTGCAAGTFGSAVATIAYGLPYLGAVFGVYAEPGDRLIEKPAFWLGATAVFATVGISTRIQATKHLQAAVSAYNNPQAPGTSYRETPPAFRFLLGGAVTGRPGMGLFLEF